MQFTIEQAAALLESQRASIEAIAVKETPVGTYAALVPVKTGGNPFAETIMYTSASEAGLAAWIDGGADDIPHADLQRQAAIARIHTAGIGYNYNYTELGANPTLSADKAKAARRSYERFVSNVAFSGDASKGLQGLFTQTGADNVTRQFSNTKDWTTATAADLLDYIYGFLTDIEQDGQLVGDTLLLPAKVHRTLASTTGADGMTALARLLAGNPYTAETGKALTVRGLKKLDTGSAGGAPRMVGYANSEDTLRLHIPMTHRFIDTWHASSTRWEIPGLFRMGGVNVVNAELFHYADNDAS